MPRTRFAPVKTTNDLLVVRSDAYELDDDFKLVLRAQWGKAPLVDLDPDYAVGSVSIDGVALPREAWSNPEGRMTVALPAEVAAGGQCLGKRPFYQGWIEQRAWAGRHQRAPRPPRT